MFNRSASLAMSTSVLKALPGKLDIKRHSPSILYLLDQNVFLYFIIDPCSTPMGFEYFIEDVMENTVVGK